MANQWIVAVCLVVAVVSQHATAQWWGMNQAARAPSPRNQAWDNQDNMRYLTCSDTNTNQDDLRVTFSMDRGNNRGGWWGNFGAMSPTLRLAVQVTSGQSSPLQGQFRLVVTTGSRVSEGCSRRTLGDILSDESWFGRSRTPYGIVGAPILVVRGQSSSSSETVDSLTMNQVRGRGVALCPQHQISGSTCNGGIPLCCRMGEDSQPANAPFTQNVQLFPGGGTQAQGLGVGNGRGAGLNFGMRQDQGSMMNNGVVSNNLASPSLQGLSF